MKSSITITGNGNSEIKRHKLAIPVRLIRPIGLLVIAGVLLRFLVPAANAATEGPTNNFFGNGAGANNEGGDNSFFGGNAGFSNTEGSNNSFFGRATGGANTTGFSNAFFGRGAGISNTTGFRNSFFGRDAGENNTGGINNAFFGESAGSSNTTENNNTFIGTFSDGAGGITNATALGFRAKVTQSHSLVLGSVAGANGSFFNTDVGIGTTTPDAPLHIRRADGTFEFLFLESVAAGPQDRPMMFLSNDGGIRFEFENTFLNTSWRFQAATGNRDNFEIAKVGTGVIELQLDGSGILTIQGTLVQNSDVNAKQNIEAVDGDTLLAKLDTVPIAEWTYKRDRSGARHLGPMAQDFHAAFGLGEDETKIAPGDMAGVNMAAIKAQQQKIVALENDNAEKRAELAAQQNQIIALADHLAALEQQQAETQAMMARVLEAQLAQPVPTLTVAN